MSPDLDEAVRRRRWAAEMCRLLDRLDPVAREAVTLSYFRRLTVDQIASRMAVPVAAVRAAIAEGLTTLGTTTD